MEESRHDFYQTARTKYSAQVRPEYIKTIRNLVLNEVASTLARTANGPENKTQIDTIILSAIDRLDTEDMQKGDKLKLLKELKDEIYGYGPIQCLVEDTGLNEIIVRGAKHVEVERRGEIMDTDVAFDDEEHLRKIIDRIAAWSNRHIDDANPMLDCKLSDGSRVNAVIPPIALGGSYLTIRKFAAIPFRIKAV